MHFVYVDDSGDENRACFSALIIPAKHWREALDHLMEARRWMAYCDGIYMAVELHSTDWLAGKGRIAKRPISKERRASLYNFFLSAIARLPDAQLINACVEKGHKDRAFEYLLNRIQRNMAETDSSCVLFCDEGKNYDNLKRRLGIHNYIKSKYGGWQQGSVAKNIPADRIIEDIVYRESKRSAFIQAADACAYALLRRERPLASKTALGLDQSFFILDKIMVKKAYASDPYGIIR